MKCATACSQRLRRASGEAEPTVHTRRRRESCERPEVCDAFSDLHRAEFVYENARRLEARRGVLRAGAERACRRHHRLVARSRCIPSAPVHAWLWARRHPSATWLDPLTCLLTVCLIQFTYLSFERQPNDSRLLAVLHTAPLQFMGSHWYEIYLFHWPIQRYFTAQWMGPHKNWRCAV